ncbi:hypothetical protein ARALYDRAFT_330953 [Arabidopsis lyrata subsp. lyrata]|uniref:Knottins-like domain-containing protein n=1 Tax=Arabidopsis lyrata subsp. lyrata TaxID=81972 RepID=D7MMH1_ARALL|nr:hypothetical protein ARALYDRAFT_330953 [Arabidopsis lyrata subsp. lyrata]
MAKFASIITLIFAALVLFAAFGESTNNGGSTKVVREANNACKNQYINLEGAKHGSCNYVFPAHKCICYVPC